MKLQFLLATFVTAEKGDELVTDVIRFYDQECWSKFCDADIVECISNDPKCGRHFTPLPRVFEMAPMKDRLSTVKAVPADQADEGGGPMLGFQDVKWSELSAHELSVIQCAKRNGCTPTEETVKEDSALVDEAKKDLQGDDSDGPASAETPAAPSSFVQVDETQRILQQMSAMKSQTHSMKDKLKALSGAKASVSEVADIHQNRMKQLEEMQVKGVAAVQGEKQFVAQSRARLAAAQEKLNQLAQVQEPNEESFLELARTKEEMRTVRADLVKHIQSFETDFPLPAIQHHHAGVDTHNLRAD